MTTTAGSGLGEHEERYLGDLAWHCRGLPAAERAALEEVAAANLGERPPATSWEDLVAQLGEPAAYLEQLRAGGPHGRRRVRTRALVGLLAGVVVLVAGGLGARAWWTAEPGLRNSCGGLHSPDPGVRVEHREAAGATEERATYVDGAEVAIFLCLTATHAVRVDDVRIPTPELSTFHQTGARAQPATDGAGGGTRPLEAFDVGPRSAWNVDVVGVLRDCEDYIPGGGISFRSAVVTYRYRGRTGHTEVDLNTTYTFVSPPADRCPRPRAGG